MDIVNPFDGFVTVGDRTVSLSQWRKEFLESDEEPVITKAFSCEFEKVGSDEDRTIKTVISDGKADRDNDTLSSEGWDLSEYEKNPVVLWAHDHSGLPVAKSTVKAFKSKLTSVDTFPKKGVYPFADMLYDLVKDNFINAKSVGFIPSEYVLNEQRGGFDFIEQALIEHSYVPVPSNPRALVVARSKGIDLAPLVGWAEKILDEWREEDGVYVPKSTVESARKEFGNVPIYFLSSDGNDGEWTVTTSTTYTDDPKETDIVDNEHDDTQKDPFEGLSEDSQALLRKKIALKSVEVELRDQGFDDDEIEETLKSVRVLEGEEVVEEEEQVAPEEKSNEEEVFTIDDEELRSAIAETVGEVKDALTELTGKVVNVN